jgi:hypothetical protein
MRYSKEHLSMLETATDEMEAIEAPEVIELEVEEFKTGAAIAAVDVLPKVCGVYQKVRPFLQLVSTLFLIPQKWRTAISGFIGTMDLVCPN